MRRHLFLIAAVNVVFLSGCAAITRPFRQVPVSAAAGTAFTLVPSAVRVAPHFELILTRPQRLGAHVLRTTTETRRVGLAPVGPDAAAGLDTFDADTAFVPLATEFVPLTPGFTTTRTDYDLKPTGGHVAISTRSDTVRIEINHRRLVSVSTGVSGARTPVFAEFRQTASTALSPTPIVIPGDGYAVLTYTFIFHP
jgi:hypothetical protein